MSDTAYYEIVAKELAEAKIYQGLWLKAKTLEPHDEKEAQALYVRLRVEELKQEAQEEALAKKEKKKIPAEEFHSVTGREVRAILIVSGVSAVIFMLIALIFVR